MDDVSSFFRGILNREKSIPAVIQQEKDIADEEQEIDIIDETNQENIVERNEPPEEDVQDIEDNTKEKDTEKDQEIDHDTENHSTSQQELESYEIRTFDTTLPQNIGIGLKYEEYHIYYDYLLVLQKANIRQEPHLGGEIIVTRDPMDKLSLISEVREGLTQGQDRDSWYQVAWEEEGETRRGFIHTSLGEPRYFQFDKMVEVIHNLNQASSIGPMGYISNYKNVNGWVPLFQGKTLDSFGYRRSQSAAGYEEPNLSSNFRYIPDGMLLNVLEQKDGFSKVEIMGFEGLYWVKDKYINTKTPLEKLNKVIVVDRKFQNEGVFELEDDQWTLVSYSFASTGKKGYYSLETPLGYYMAIQKRDKFLYFKDGTTQIAGYAPYAIRFSGGGYIHGVPIDYILRDGKRIDPGMREYLHTIGTIPRSHMCVRNFTSHAKFLYEWADIGETVVIIIE